MPQTWPKPLLSVTTRRGIKRMTDPNATPAKREKLPLHWAEDESFDLTPSLQPPAGALVLVNPPVIVPGESPPPPFSAP
jgi:hypothetical protein